jgi:hypothetical protein
MVAKMEELEVVLERTEAAVNEFRERMLSEDTPPLLLIFALFHKGITMTSVKLDPEEKLMVCDSLQTFINDTKELIVEWRN